MFGISIVALFLSIIASININAEAIVLKGNAVIYHGPGACEHCPEAIAVRLRKMGYNINYIYPGEFSSKLFKNNTTLYVQPGGTDDIEETLKALTSSDVPSLKSFIANGGHYLGICAGGYLAGHYSHQNKKFKAFGLIPLTVVEEEIEHTKALLLPVTWNKKTRYIYAQSSPSFGNQIFPTATVIARFSNTGHIAAMISSFGKGVVGVIGPHPEADEEWYGEDKLSLEYGLNFDLFEDFVEKLASHR